MLILNKKKDKDFLILNFTDIHLRDRFWNNDNVRKVIPVHVMKTLIEEVKPDLITVTGDIACCFQYDTYNGIADFFESYGIPWAVVWGNHDDEGGTEPIEEIERLYADKKHIMYESGDPSLGRGNYVIGIEEDGRPVEALIMMDTHARVTVINSEGNEENAYDKLSSEQISWYRDQVRELKAKGYKESALFLHMPIYAYKEAFKAAFLKGIDPREVRYHESLDPLFWNEGYKDSYGIMNGKIRPHIFNDGVFEAILEEDSTKTIICGHDHRNNFVVKHKGVRFVYATRTGNSSFDTKHPVGGTVIRISSDGVEEVIQRLVKVSHLKETYVYKPTR